MDTSTPTDRQESTEEQLSPDTSRPEVSALPTNQVVDSQPISPTPPVVSKPQNNAITLVLQWLTYASWLWFSGAILWLSGTVIGYFVQGVSSSIDTVEVLAYPIAAVIVLLLVSSVIDLFYARREPEHKEGFATVIMVIHAVIFALCGIGTLIVTVFTLINLLIQGGTVNSSGKASLVGLLVSLVGLVVYLALIARTAMVAKVKRLPLVIAIVMAVLSIGFVIAAFTGPVANAVVAKQDKELEDTLPSVAYAVDDYVRTNAKLPSSLDGLDFSNSYYGSGTAEDVKAVVKKALIKYTANTKEPSDNSNYYRTLSSDPTASKSLDLGSATYYYRLCVTWHAEKNGGGTIEPMPADDVSSTSGASASYATNDPSYVSTYTHKKGEQCYNLSSTAY